MVRRARFLLIAFVVSTACAAVSGQQPNRKAEPYVAPLLPAEAVWLLTLGAPPAAGGAMDDERVYIPLQNLTTDAEGEPGPLPGSAAIIALDRERGSVRWNRRIESVVPPLVAGGWLLVAAGEELHALQASTGIPEWHVAIGGRIRAPMLRRGSLLIALTDPDELVAVRIDTREIVWRQTVGETGPVLMEADDRAVYLSAGSRLRAVSLVDGSVLWERRLDGTLGAPALGDGRVFVGSDARWFWALDPESGRDKWVWRGRMFGGDVLGADVDDDLVYVASLDNIVRALNQDSGNLRWDAPTGRPIVPPRAFFGVVVVTSVAPTLATFLGEDGRLGKRGTPIATWSAPEEAELQGPPLIDEHLKPFRVAIVVIMRDGRVTGLRPTGMMFPEPTAGTLTTLPGRPLPKERVPGEPEPALFAPVSPAR